MGTAPNSISNLTVLNIHEEGKEQEKKKESAEIVTAISQTFSTNGIK